MRPQLMVLALTLLAPTALAHELPSKRHILAQVSPTAVRIMVTHEEPQNERTKLMMAQFDVNRDGQLAPEEAKLATSTWSQYVLAGLTFEIPGERPRAKAPQIKIERTERGSIATAVLMEFELPRASSRALIARASDKARTPSKIIVEGAHGLALHDVNGYPPPTRPMPTISLAQGAELRFVLRGQDGP